MTDKELQKLGRRELLQLLLQQAKESERLSRQLTESEDRLHQLEETYERLRGRLDNKDAQIRELKATLRSEREKREIDMEDVGSIAEAALKLNGVFDAAQRAADQYLQSIRSLYPAPENMEIPEEPVYERPPRRSAAEEPAAARAAQAGTRQSGARQSGARREPQPLRETEPPRDETQAQEEKPEQAMVPRPRRPFQLRKEKGKTTLFFGWQHD